MKSIEKFTSYEEFLQKYAELIHRIGDEFHRLFRVTDRRDLQNIRVIPPESLGSCPDWDRVRKDGVIRSYYDNAVLFEPIKNGHGYTHRLFVTLV